KRPFKSPFLDRVVTPLKGGTMLGPRILPPVDVDVRLFPAIATCLRYRKKDGTREEDALLYPYPAENGPAGVRVDSRGSGGSEGSKEHEYAQRGRDDSLKVIAVVADEPWNIGRVTMTGVSRSSSTRCTLRHGDLQSSGRS